MVESTNSVGARESIRFENAPWPEGSDEWKRLDALIPQDDVARLIVRGVKRLDLGPLCESYSRSGSPPVRPDLMLCIVLIEIQRGRCSPSEWHRDTARRDYGIDVIDVQLQRFDFPERNRPRVYVRMKSERARISMKYRSEARRRA